MKKKFMTLIFTFVSLFALFASFYVSADAESLSTTVYLQQQENDEHTKIRYIATIENLDDVAALKSIRINFTLSDEDTAYAETASDTIDTIYTAVEGLFDTEDGTYYAIYTLTDIATFEDYVITAEVEFSVSDTTLTTNKVSHHLTDENYLELSYLYNVLEGQSAAGNGQYLTKSLQEVYLSDSDFSSTGILGTINDASAELTFDTKLFDAKDSGEVVVTANANGESSSFKVYKVSTALSVVDGVAKVKVNQSYTGQIGAIVDGFNMFTTIKQALDFLSLNSSVACDSRLLYVCAGTYNEKLDISLSNLTIEGADEATTIIEYDSLYGTSDQLVYDKSGNKIVHTTDSTMTMAIRDTATGCTLKNITVSNWWNSEERFNSKLDYLEENGLVKSGVASEHRALALLVQADQFIAENVTLLGYQDTLELMTGRQYFNNCYISGTTDFIFGTNNTTLFDSCEIHTIYNGSTDGGYVNAFKGQNKSSSDSIAYGVIYDNCDFTADDLVTSSNTAIARPWGQTSAVMVMNSRLGAHISTLAYTEDSTKNQRYVAMSGCEPTVSTVKFYEYNNTGAGAISESINGCTVLTDASEALNYSTYSVIYGVNNGNVVYNLAWDPVNGLAADTNIYYNFNGTDEETGTNYTFETGSAKISTGSTLTLGDMTIDCTAGSAAYNSNSNKYNFKNGAIIRLTVTAGSSVTIKAHAANYANFTINGIGTITDTLVQYFDEAQTIEIVINGDTYIGQIIVNPSATAPEAATVSSLAITGAPTADFSVGDAYDLSGITVKAIYSDNTYITLTSSDYTIDESSIDINAEGTYVAVVSYSGVTADIELTYVLEYDSRVLDECTWSFRDDTKNEASDYFVWDSTAAEFSKLTLSGAYSDNGNYIKFNEGATAKFEVADACTVGVAYYQHISCIVYLDGVEIATTDTWSSENAFINYTIPHGGVVTVVATSEYNGQSYLTYIKVSDIVYSVKKDTVLDFSTADGIDALASINGVDASLATISANGNNAKVSGTIAIRVKAGAVIYVASYKGYASYTIGEEGALDLTTYTAPTYYIASTDQLVEIICGSSNYFYQIGVYYPTSEDITWSFRTDTSNGDEFINTVQSASMVCDGLLINGESGKLAPRASQWAQFNTGTEITFVAPAYSTVTISMYANSYTINGEEATAATTTLSPTTDTVYTIIASGNTYIDYISIQVAEIISETTSFTCKGGSYSGENLINLNSDGTLTTASTTISGVTFVGAKSNGADNWVKINKDATISFVVEDAATLNLCFYSGSNNVTVELDGVAITTESTGSTDSTIFVYNLTAGGKVVITSTADNTYIGFIQVVFE